MAASAISDYIAGLDETLGAVSAALTAHLDTGLPGTVGQLWHGHPVWMRDKTPIAGFKAYPNYVTFMLWRGQAIDDPFHLAACQHLSSPCFWRQAFCGR